jgi:hypothetical protein
LSSPMSSGTSGVPVVELQPGSVQKTIKAIMKIRQRTVSLQIQFEGARVARFYGECSVGQLNLDAP